MQHHKSHSSTHQNMVGETVRWMNQEFSESLDTHRLAKRANYSPFHFHRVFQAVTGLSPGRYLCAIRINAATDLLLRSEEKITDICFQVGYNSLGTFTTRFKKLVGLTPSEVREMGNVPIDLAMLEYDDQPSCSTSDEREDELAFILSGIESPETTVFVGAFPRPIPVGRPQSCAIVTGNGKYGLRPIPKQPFYLMGAAISCSNGALEFSRVNKSGDIYVATSSRLNPVQLTKGFQSPLELVFRPMKVTDPPILSALPLLIDQH